MKRCMIALLLIGLFMALSAYPLRLQSFDPKADVKILNAKNVSVDYVNNQTGIIIVYVRDAQEEDLIRSLGFIPERLPEPHLFDSNEQSDNKDNTTDPQYAYYSITEYHTFMQNMANQYPNICQLVQIGNSGQNRPLYYLKISDNVTQNENEPEFRYVSSIHGDEVVGYDLLIRLIQLLTSSYGTDTRITNLVNNTEIWINPMYNPDGYVLQQRFNSAGIDLNRNFPTPTGVQHPDSNQWGVENVAFMNYMQNRRFSSSINFHGGAEVMNYPWDHTYTLAPDDALLISMSLSYSMHNSSLYNSTEFPQGITNGAAWYVITGSLQDWSYGLTDCIDITGEISNIKWPAASTLDSYWNLNRESMLSYMEYAQKGLHGFVTSTGGVPLDASITISGNPRLVHTDASLGDYHRILLGGTYQVTANATGYIPQTQTVVIPASGSASLNFELSTAEQVSMNGTVRDSEGNAISAATVLIGTVPQTTLNTATDGTFSIPLIYEGVYPIMIYADGYGNLNTNFALNSEDTSKVFVLQEPIFVDDFENGLTNWTVVSPWAISLDMGNNVLKDSPSGNYSSNINKSARTTNPISLANVSNPRLSFDAKFSLENSYDFVYIEACSSNPQNNSSWSQLGNLTGSQTSWQNYSYSLSAYAGGNCYIRFRIDTDQSVNEDGISIDNVQISGLSGLDLPAGDLNSDQIIDFADYKGLLDYVCGFDPFPTVDALPWGDGRIEASDVSNDGQINSIDAWMIRHYTQNPDYRFSSQTGIPSQEIDPQISLSYNDGVICSFENSIDLKAIDMSITSSTGVNLDLLTISNPSDVIYSINHQTSRFALIKPLGVVCDISAEISTTASSLECSGTTNGYAYNLIVNASNTDDVPGLINNNLMQNYPNPFNPMTTIAYSVKNRDYIRLQVFNLRGQLVKTLVNEANEPGLYEVKWDGLDYNGTPQPSGLYFYKIQIGAYTAQKQMILLK